MNYVVIHHFIKENITREMMNPHVDYLKVLFENGKLIITGPFIDEKKGGMFILDVNDAEELHEIVNNDPAIIEGHARAEIRPYQIVFSKIELG